MTPRLPLPVWAALAVFALHTLIALAFDKPGMFRKYPLAAEQHLAGELPAERRVDLSPLYFELTVLATRLHTPADRLLEGVQIVLVGLAAGLLAALLAPRFGRAGTVAALAVFALDRHLLVYERVLEPEAGSLFLVLGWLYSLERAVSARWALFAGLFAAASLALRPTFLPLALLVPLYLRLRHRDGWRRRALAFGAPVVLALALLTLRTATVTDDPRTPVMNPGTVFYEGNNPLSHGTSAIYPRLVLELTSTGEALPDVAHVHYRTVARAATGAPLSIAEVNAYWSGLALEHLRGHPRRALELLGEKLLHTFHAYRWHDVSSARLYDRRLPIPGLPFALLAALALVGLLAEAARWRQALPFYALAGAQIATMLVFYVSARQRLGMLPALIFFAAAAVAAMARLWRGGERRRAGLWVLFTAVLGLSLSLPTDLMRDDRAVREGRARAQARLDELRRHSADATLAAHAELALEALADIPWVEWTPAWFPQEEAGLAEQLAARLETEDRGGAPAAFDRAEAYLRAGRLDDAEALYRELIEAGIELYRDARQAADPHLGLARVEARRGSHQRAVELLMAALERSPDHFFLLAELAVLSGEARHRERLLATAGELDGRYLLGQAYLDHGRAEEAVAELSFVSDRLPGLRSVQIHLAAALAAAGHVDEAAARYLEARRRAPDPLLRHREVSDLFRRWAARHPGDPRVQLFAARVLGEHGRFQEALELLEKVEVPLPLRSRLEETRRLLQSSAAAVDSAMRRE